MHSMAFHGGLTETVLFRGWSINDAQGMVGSVIGVILLSALYEGLKSYRDYLYVRTACIKRKQKKSRHSLLFSGIHLFQTLLHVIQVVLGYFLMFIFMTYNYWLCIAIGVGTALGYWLFAWEKSNNENTECCSVRESLDRHSSSISDIRVKYMMADSRSCATICSSKSNNPIRQYSSVRQIILGWNMFSIVTWFLLLALFCIWCLTFFFIYTPKPEDDHMGH
ncbi:high affinity copper uptake protein 1-like [Odontomachus brunneus]|uniref:high affinity copper uptake protein 1-like n=1 Tax=Odontomachus brunneus TaxID=486640 RepID=UPI0013F21516|nr:high affinity copper uptake protein 1-like [Odontomachus brunneus]